MNAVVMNPDSFNNLPPDIQKIFLDLEPWFNERRLALQTEQEDGAIQKCKELGHTFAELSPEVTQEWMAAAKPIHDGWIADVESKGKPGQAFYNEVQQLIKKYK